MVHGWAVFQSIRQRSPGTPVWFLTGTEDPDFAADINNEHGPTADLHSHGTAEQMYRVFWKKRISDCIRDVGRFHQGRTVLEGIALTHPVELQLNADDCRVLRLYSRRKLGALAVVSSVNGGLSNSRLLKVLQGRRWHGSRNCGSEGLDSLKLRRKQAATMPRYPGCDRVDFRSWR